MAMCSQEKICILQKKGIEDAENVGASHRGNGKSVVLELTMTDDDLKAIEARLDELGDFKCQECGFPTVYIRALLDEVKCHRCPIGLDDAPDICSASSCPTCMASRLKGALDEVERLRAYIREITTTKPANKPTFDAGPYWGPSGGSHD